MFLLWPRCWAGVCPWESQGAYGVGAESCFLTWHWLGPWWARGSFLCCSQPLLQCGFQCLLVAPHVQTKGRSFLYPLVSLRLLLVGAKFLLGSTEVDVFKNWKGSSIFASSTVTIFFFKYLKNRTLWQLSRFHEGLIPAGCLFDDILDLEVSGVIVFFILS